MPAYELSINGKKRKVEAPAEMPLLWVLRDLLNLTGTKFGCGAGQYRACTVHVNGEAIFSCQLPISSVVGKSITTIEGLSSGGTLHAVQRAWVEEDVPQCGYCQPGQIMSACALLAKNKNPSDQDIDTAMNANICRCGTYNFIRRAIHRVATDMSSHA